MTTAHVPATRGTITYEDILSGRAVRAITWQDWAQLCAWLGGQGGHVAAAHAPAVKLLPLTVYRTHMLTRGSFAAIQRVWCFWIRAHTLATTAVISVNGGAGTTHLAAATRRASVPVVIVEDVASQSAAASDLRYDITPAQADKSVWLDAVTVWEVPRVLLDDATAELGVPMDPFRSGQPILNSDLANGSELVKDDEHGRRYLFSWGVPHHLNAAITKSHAWSTASGTLTEAFDLPPPLLATKGVPGEVQRAVRVRYTALVDTGVTAEVHIGTTARGATLSDTITSTSFATYSTTRTVDVEDTSEASGLQGGSWDGLKFQARITAGTGSVYVFAIAVYED